MRPRARCPFILSFLFLAAGCGPTPEQAGGVVLLVAPVAMVVAALLVRFLVWLWRPAERLPLSSRPALIAALACLALGAGAAFRIDGLGEYFLIALALFGTSYLAIALVAWRIWMAFDRASASTWSFVPVASLLIAPALPLALGLAGEDFVDVVAIAWVYPGYFGLVPFCVLVALAAEAVARRRASGR